MLREDIMFDKLGGYRPAIQKMAQELLLLPYRRMLALMQDSFTGSSYTCFDSYPLFSSSHAFGDNSSALNLSDTNLDTACDTMRQFADPVNSDPLLIEPTHIWFHTDLTSDVENLMDIQLVSTGGTNKWYNRFKKVPLALGTGYEKYWGLFSLQEGDPLKPIVWQYVPGADQFTALDSADSEQNFMRRQLLYGTEAWGAVACGLPFYAWGSTGT